MTKKDSGSAPVSDPISMEVYNNRLMTIVEGMLHILVRSSFSTNVKERRDCSVGLFDATGRVLAQTVHTPLHLGSTVGAVSHLLKEFSPEEISEGDAFMCNDPYVAGGTHLPDITVVSPVFYNGKLSFFLANIAHHSDVGGVVPGSISGTAETIFAEGIRIPIVRLRHRGKVQNDIVRLVTLNTRDPKERELDLGVQLATNDRGIVMAQELLDHIGDDRLTAAIADMIAYTRQRLLNQLATFTSKEAGYEAFLDDDGIGDEPVRIAVRISVSGGKLLFDFSGTGPQAAGAMNIPFNALQATVVYCVKMMIDPGLMPNHGIFDCIGIQTPGRSIVSPAHPAAVGARSITANKVARAVIGALAQMLPQERGIASGQDIVPGICFAGKRSNGDDYVYMETIGGGSGGTAEVDGMDGVQVHVTNTSNLPVEALEHEYNLLVDEYALVEDSCGAGKYRGGLGIARQIAATEDDVIFSVRSDGHIYPPPGLRDGQDGRCAKILFNSGSAEERELDSKTTNFVLNSGDSIRIETPGGGGYGPVSERSDKQVIDDIENSKTSLAFAKKAYGPSRIEQIVEKSEQPAFDATNAAE
ncbi:MULTISPECIES: hydantoinase B/oxoprolinase family protein [unclassified Mesorhizobium]|uniref:hydantoinase B/oxoprolinase family protein n=1 Tax=unclassified Mesorhizobium TaxID=325217 RepID=UPI000FE465E0|nr:MULTISPECIES: hydantoinase B/oxoprolinase family protein [unclassified Mesorhizobium]RWE83092.1 MAG: hydantoinase B/oxoprolinase family protein [Mesorhizobium sp.]TGQ85764.1 hydantoinase B/oxoprolinase family protein [Mesorhizobium sp. M8A.F.Ca.ET.208.01.1.1]TGT47650.1 hydantoinase B/oxoprolinase family protein [Mesorhizobium sp. M8A.F.Ca.ET.167.01.1.1]TIR03252.1 MAG: hydantoinase B/oxoprolinase family protein [Mesorhizobium sp.]